MKLLVIKVLASLAVLLIGVEALAYRHGEVYRLFAGQSAGLKRDTIVALTPRGVVFLNGKLELIRAYRFRGLQPYRTHKVPHIAIADLEGDGNYEVVLLGKPTFALSGSGKALFEVRKTCMEAGVFSADENRKSVACGYRGGISTYRYDGQFIWDFKYKGRPGQFVFTDMNADGNEDMEAVFFGRYRKAYRLNGLTGAEISSDKKRQEKYSSLYTAQENRYRAILSGSEKLDLDGDKSPRFLKFSGAVLSIVDDKGQALGTFNVGSQQVFSVAVSDLTGDKAKEIVLGLKRRIVVLDNRGKLLAERGLNMRKYSRKPTVQIKTFHARGFRWEGKVRKVINRGLKGLTRCYKKVLKRNPVGRWGKVMVRLTIDKHGRVSSANKIYGTLGYPKVISCMLGKMKRMRFPRPNEDEASMNGTFLFNWKGRLPE